jgi:hypothetical protein
MASSPRTFYLSGSGLYFAGLLFRATITFWPTYVSLPPAANSPYTHFHAMIATVWILMLIAQPMLIRNGRLTQHRTLGKLSWLVAPVFVASVILLAHNRISGLEGQAYGIQTYILWLQISLGAIFALSWVLAMIYRKNMEYHARFMICTGLTLIDPVVVRLLLWIEPVPAWNYQWLTFGLTDLALLALIWMERNRTRGRAVFPVMLGVFGVIEAPALLGMTDQAWWQSYAAWVAALPLT